MPQNLKPPIPQPRKPGPVEAKLRPRVKVAAEPQPRLRLDSEPEVAEPVASPALYGPELSPAINAVAPPVDVSR